MAKKGTEPPTGEKPTFEESLERLEQIVLRLEEGETSLGQSLGDYEEGVKLLRRCYDLLEEAQRKIELLSGVDSEGNPITSPLDELAGSSPKEG